MIINPAYLLPTSSFYSIELFADCVIYDRFLSRVLRCSHLIARNSYSLVFIKYHLSLKYNYYNDRHQIFCVIRITMLQCDKNIDLKVKTDFES